MAQFFPARASCRFATAGERRLAERLDRLLEDDYLCWHDVPVGPYALHPDFVILHPARGLLVLEVKDWKLDTIRRLDRYKVDLAVGGRLKSVKNPLTQAWAYACEISRALERDPQLIAPDDAPHAGKLVLPWGWGAVLTNITRAQFDSTDLGEALNPQLVMCRDEMADGQDAEAFQQRLWDMFLHPFQCRLALPQIDRIRWHLYPEVRVPAPPEQASLPLLDALGAPHVPDIVRVMDLQQEQLARSLGDGHRVIHGAAGSGKTMILGYRCAHLASALHKPVLVLCYNRTLAARLAQVMSAQGLGDRVTVRHFHGWCRDMLRAYHVPLPANAASADEWARGLVQRTIEGVDRGLIPRGQYGAVLIDEGHDFEPEWFRLVVQMVDPDTDSLLVLYDDAQAIYRRPAGLGFSFASVGIQAQGRTTILRLNYRNTWQILVVAQRFAEGLLEERGSGDDDIPRVAPKSAGRQGPIPELITCEHAWQEWQCVAERVREQIDQGRSADDIAVIYRSHWQARRIARALSEAGVEFVSAADAAGKDGLYGDRPSVKIVSMHSSKGLEFGFVLVAGLDQLRASESEESDEARLLYVAMTRATDQLVMTHRRPSAFTRRIHAGIASLQRHSPMHGGRAA